MLYWEILSLFLGGVPTSTCHFFVCVCLLSPIFNLQQGASIKSNVCLSSVHFPPKIDRQRMSPKESDQINLVKNFPCDISDEEVVNFLKEEVDDKINANDIN